MVDVFKWMLKEMLYVEAIVVIDASDLPSQMRDKFSGCPRTPEDLGSEKDRMICALNKAGLAADAWIEWGIELPGSAGNGRAVQVLEGTGMNAVWLKGIVRDVVGGGVARAGVPRDPNPWQLGRSGSDGILSGTAGLIPKRRWSPSPLARTRY